jgi:hypothetical protein
MVALAKSWFTHQGERLLCYRPNSAQLDKTSRILSISADSRRPVIRRPRDL